MSKFKKGDRVRYVSNGIWSTSLPGHNFGDEFYVTEANTNGVRLDPEVWSASGSGAWWYKDRFELVTDSELEWTEVEARDLKAGEKVQYLGVEWEVKAYFSYSSEAVLVGHGDLYITFTDKVKALRPKPLELPTEPLSVFWGRLEHNGEAYEGVLTVAPNQRYCFTAKGAVHPLRVVTRLPWPKDELEKFKAGLK